MLNAEIFTDGYQPKLLCANLGRQITWLKFDDRKQNKN